MTTLRPLAARRAIDIACLIVFAVIALWSWWPADLLSNNILSGGGVGDPAAAVSALAWVPFSLGHHLNPLFTNWQNYPVGLNVATNAFAPLLGLFAWPVTVGIGPVAAVNVIFPLAFFASAVSMFVVSKRLGISRFPSFVAGLLFGFSPYMVGQSLGHLAILWTFLIPIMLLLLYRVLSNTADRPRQTGLLLGLVCALQVYLADELLASVAVISVLTAAICLAARPKRAWARLRHALVPLACSLVVFVPLAGPYIWYALFGPLHLTGPAQPIAGLDGFSSDLLSPVVPDWLQRVAPAHLAAIGGSFEYNNILENGAYLGVPLLAVAIYVAFWKRRDLVVICAGIVALLGLLISFGPHLVINNRMTPIPMPFDLLLHLPLISSQVPSRYSLFLQLGAAVLCAKLLDYALIWARTQPAPTSRLGLSNQAGVVLIAAIVLIPLIPEFPIPDFPIHSESTGVPRGITSMDRSRVPFGSVLLAYPYPGPTVNDQAMLWQALLGFRFKLVGGYSVFRTPTGAGSTIPALLQPSGVQSWFYTASFGYSEAAQDTATVPGYPHTVARAAEEIDQFIVRYHVATVVVDPVGVHPKAVVRAVSQALGLVRKSGGVYVWYGAQALARERIASGTQVAVKSVRKSP